VLDFIDNVEAVLQREGLDSPDPVRASGRCSALTRARASPRALQVLEELNRLHRNFKTHQQRLFDEKVDAERRIPELEENLRLLQVVHAKKSPVNARFMAADGVWADAVLDAASQDEQAVCLWLGANVLMQYTYSEAASVLETSLGASTQILASKNDELAFVKDQLTLCEVTISRFYNYGVARRRKANAAATVRT
jgi:hypothetical protein